MYGQHETELKAALADVIPGVSVLGHLDLVDLEKGPPVQLKLSWLGYRVQGRQVGKVGHLPQRWAAVIIVNAARIDEARHTEIEQAFLTLVERMLAFRYQRYIRAELDPTPEPSFSGQVMELGVFFTIGAIAGAQQE